MPINNIDIYDRIKEYSYTIGTGNFVLGGAVAGFSSFGSAYSNSDVCFYAATDGTYYEVGSGVYVTGVQNSLARFPFKSTNNNNRVSFGEGLKEVFVTYPATHSVYSSSGINNSIPKSSGVAIWSSPNVVSADPNIIWNSTNSRLGIKKSNPSYAIDVGGTKEESVIRSSGLICGVSGVYFPPGNNNDYTYVGGRQLYHYEPIIIDTGTYSNLVLQTSGIAQNNLSFKQQNAGFVFAGPASGCTPPCSPDYPSFRPLTWEDIPKLPFKTITSSYNSGSIGDMCIDSSYLYIKTAAGWRRISLGGVF